MERENSNMSRSIAAKTQAKFHFGMLKVFAPMHTKGEARQSLK